MGLPSGGSTPLNPDTYFAPGPREEIEQVRTEAALLTSAHIGQHILDAVPDVALIVNDKRQIVAANARALKALGVGYWENVLGKRWAAFIQSRVRKAAGPR